MPINDFLDDFVSFKSNYSLKFSISKECNALADLSLTRLFVKNRLETIDNELNLQILVGKVILA